MLRVFSRPLYLWLGGALLALALAAWSVLIEPGLLTVTQTRIVTPKWPADRAPLKIVFLADFHVGAPHVNLERLEEIVARANDLEPDLILLGGDYTCELGIVRTAVAPEAVAARLAGLRARYGVVAVLGNHDWWLDGERVTESLRSAGITVLENRAHEIRPGDRSLWIAGIADDTTRRPKVRATLAQVPESAPVIVLAHDPASFEDVSERAVLTLAGHTHGGQVYLPFYGAVIVPSRAPRSHAYGHIRERGRDLLVSGGIGTSILPVRFNMPPEINLVRIEAAGASN